MIRIFRDLRQELVKEKKFSRYLIYAVGEILLVVFGILIALQINTWNQANIEGEKEVKYLNNIKKDLYQQLSVIEEQIKHERESSNSANRLLKKYFEQSELIIDHSFVRDLSRLTSRKTFISIDPTYTDLVSSGNISLISEDEIRLGIIKYYQSVERLVKVLQNNNTINVDNHFKYFVLNNATLNSEYLRSLESKFSDSLNIKFFSSDQNPKLLQISDRLLNQDKNELNAINALNLRNNTAMAHYSSMLDLKLETQQLIKDLEEFYKIER